ncbi:MAG: hypothetical protein U0166_23265 [Acidobacteriota bacterium]
MTSTLMMSVATFLMNAKPGAAARGGGSQFADIAIAFFSVFMGGFIVLVVVSKMGGDIDLSKGVILSALLGGAGLAMTQMLNLDPMVAAIAMGVVTLVLSVAGASFTPKTGVIAGVLMAALEYAVAGKMFF